MGGWIRKIGFARGFALFVFGWSNFLMAVRERRFFLCSIVFFPHEFVIRKVVHYLPLWVLCPTAATSAITTTITTNAVKFRVHQPPQSKIHVRTPTP